MRRLRTTICCSALSLSLLFAQPISGQGGTKTSPLLFRTLTVWTLDLNSQLTAPPGLDAKRAYFSTEGDGLAAYDLATGKHDWTVPVRPQMEPAAGDGLLFVVESKSLSALHAADGTLAWQLPLAEKLAVRPVWDNGWLIVATVGGTLLAFRAHDGFLVWRRALGSPAHGMSALAADRVYVPTADGRVVALSIETGASVWERRLGGAASDILALDDRLYVGSKDNFFYCVDARTGRVEWRWRTGGDVIGLPVVDDNNVYFVSLDNVLRSLARKSGVQRWFRVLPLRPASGPLLADGTLIIAGVLPTLHRYNLKDGTTAGEVPTNGELAAPPRLVAGDPRVLVVTRDLAKGASAMVITRVVQPKALPLAPLPNPELPAPIEVAADEQG